ncbi:hypothetical protein L1987_44400 [Smallanthus sonchifolius]|uniref:Uncharacterized protein n=1 Tax=Smallanthus sonchifolius TaxID=185202 RepID=A0ACB9GPB4_9ASTR|nr:hypothetical protein L1987_44400 [Smallanthus sonchifolius]
MKGNKLNDYVFYLLVWNSTQLGLIPAIPHLSHAVILLFKLREMILKFASVVLLLGILFVWILLKLITLLQ